MGRILESRAFLIAAFVLFAAVTFWTTLHHEIWSDEGDPWLLMRDADLGSIFRSASNGGVPLLFHWTIFPFARLGAPPLAMQLLNLMYVWAAVALLFRSTAFPALVKVLFAFSYFPAFEFAVITRPYGLQMLLTFAMAACWRERREHPVRLGIIVALLANTSTLGLVTAAVAGALLLFERLRTSALAIMILGGLIAGAQLIPREGRQQVYQHVLIADTIAYALASAFFPDGRINDFVWPAMLVLALVTYGISRRALPVLFLWIAGTILMLIYIFIWMGGIRHAGVLLLLVVAAVWIADAYGPYRNERMMFAGLAVAFAFSIVPAWRAWVSETKYAFSGSREVARFIQKNGLDRDILVSYKMFWTAPLAYLPQAKIWYPAARRFETYTLWERQDYLRSKMPIETVIAEARQQLRGRRWVLIMNREIPKVEEQRFRLLFQTQMPIWRVQQERYWIYEPVERPKPLAE